MTACEVAVDDLRTDNANLRVALAAIAKDCDAITRFSLPDLRMQAMWLRALVKHIAGEALAAARRGLP